MTLKQLIHEALERTPGGDPHDIAKRIRKKVPEDDILRLIAREVEWSQRRLVHRAEEQTMAAFRSRFSGRPLPPLSIDPGLRALFRTSFRLGDGAGAVVWGDATIEDHTQRIAFLSKQRDGIDQTIGRHLAAIELIREAGVTCLNDLIDQAA